MEGGALFMSITSASLNISPLQKYQGPFSLPACQKLWELLVTSF